MATEHEVARLVVHVGTAGVEQAQRALSGFGNEVGGIGKVAMGAFKVGMLGATAGLGALTASLFAATKAAMEQEKAEAQLNAVLASTKHAAGLSADEIKRMASELQSVTTYGDEAIISGQNLLLTFTNIGKDVFPEATEIMLDMSEALGQDLKSSAIQLGKALQDPIEGVSALRRVGVNFTDAQQKMIKQMVEAGKIQQAQKFILAELRTEFGGSARAAANTFGGAMTQVRNAVGDVFEEIGLALIPSLTQLAKWVNAEVVPAFAKWAKDAAPQIQKVLQQLGDWLKREGIPALQSFKKWFDDNIPPIVSAVKVAWEKDLKPALDALRKWFETDGKQALNTFFTRLGEFKPLVDEWRSLIDDLRSALDELNADIEKTGEHFGWLDTLVSGTFDNLQAVIKPALDSMRQTQKLALAAQEGDWLAAMTAIGDIAFNTFKFTIPGMLTRAMTPISNTVRSIGWSAGTAIGDAINQGFGTRTLTILQSILKPFQDAIYQLHSINWGQVAHDIMRAIYDVISGWSEWIFGALFDPFSDAILAIKRLLGIRSPSRLMMQIGEQMARGLELGFAPRLGLAVGGQWSAVSGRRAAVSQSSVTNHYNLTIHSQARVEQVASDFAMMKALASV